VFKFQVTRWLICLVELMGQSDKNVVKCWMLGML